MIYLRLLLAICLVVCVMVDSASAQRRRGGGRAAAARPSTPKPAAVETPASNAPPAKPVAPPAGTSSAPPAGTSSAPPAGTSSAPPAEAPPDDYTCYFTEGPIEIDGKAAEAAWKVAKPVNDFGMAWARDGQTKPKTATRAKMLWDREHVYFFAEMDDSDLYADVTQHDGSTWNNDVFELFFKPADDKPGYYEFQVNAANTTLDAFMPRRGAGGFDRFKGDGDFDFKTEVVLNGSLNQWHDHDQGWTVEGRLSWKDFSRTGGRPVVGERWKFALCRYDYSVDFEGPCLSSCAPLKTNPHPDFHYWEDYAPIRFVGPQDSPRHAAARPFGIEKLAQLTSSRVLGSPDPPLPYTAERIFKKLPINNPVAIGKQPQSDWIWIVTQLFAYGPATLARFRNLPDSDSLETLAAPSGDEVLYDICFHPGFGKNGYVYIGSNGSYGGPKRSRVTRYYVDPASGNFDPASATVIIEWESDGHNGAAIAFGNDGMMYVTTGDGTNDSDTNLRGQDLSHLTAKLLRIDVDFPDAGKTYRVPEDNPFLGKQDVRPETWAYGFRNPWRIAVDRKTGQVWIGQNGQDLWEQVYLVECGANYGWSVMEGGHEFYASRKRGPHPISKPIAEHPHSEARSLTGGIVYRGDNAGLSELVGAYLYGDYSTGKIWAIKHDGIAVTWHKEIADTPLMITGFAEGNEGDVWILDHSGRAIYRLVPTPPVAPKQAFPRKLSESGLFQDVARHKMADGVIPYSVNSPLWSDGSYKERYLAIPHKEGQDMRIDYAGSNGWTFPNETVIVKSFALEALTGDPSSRRWVETRFILREQNEWVGYSYRWNAEQTDAELVEAAGADAPFEIRDTNAPGGVRTQIWHYPSRTECMVCHSRAANYVLGLQTAQMNRDHDYDGMVDNQLRTLEHLGMFRVAWGGENYPYLRNEFIEKNRRDPGAVPDDADWEKAIAAEADAHVDKLLKIRDQRQAPQISPLLYRDPVHLPKIADPHDAAVPLAARARSYLHSNCAHCHVEAGGGNAKINLHMDTPLAKMNLLDEKPSHQTFGIEGARLIAPGAPDRSVLLHRLKIRGSGQMPQLATSMADHQAIQVLSAWISSLPLPTISSR